DRPGPAACRRSRRTRSIAGRRRPAPPGDPHVRGAPMTLHRRSPRPVAAALAPMRDAWAPATLLGEIQAIWTDAVGRAIAAEAQPVSEHGGVVTVACSAAVWAQELDLLSATLVERLNDCLRSGRITRLRCTVTSRP